MINVDAFELEFGCKVSLEEFDSAIQALLPGLGDIKKMTGDPLKEALKAIELLKWAGRVRPKTAFILTEEGRESELKRFGEAQVKAAADKATPPGLGWFYNNRRRPECFHENCKTLARSKGRCIRHGGGSRCVHEDCKTVARKGGKCFKHLGGEKKLCEVKDCKNGAKKGGKCIKHGGGNRCEVKDCKTGARGMSGKCWNHRGK